MDANTMRANFILGYEGARLANRTFNDREITAFLNKAQEEFVKQRYDILKNRTQRGLGNAIRDAELSGLVTGARKYAKQVYINGTVYNPTSAGSAYNPFMAGSAINGALRRPDWDETFNSGEQPSDQFGIFVGLPDECLYVLLETADTIKGTCVRTNVPVEKVNMADYLDAIYNPYWKPYDNLVWSMDWGTYTVQQQADTGLHPGSNKTYTTTGAGYNMQGASTTFWNGAANTTKTVSINTNRSRQLIAGKDSDIIGYYVNYIIRPTDITVDVQTPSNQVNCILPAFTHQEIVDMAVKLASASIIPEPNKYQVNQIESKEDE